MLTKVIWSHLLLPVSAKISNFLFKDVGFLTFLQCTCSLTSYLFGVLMLQGLLYLFSYNYDLLEGHCHKYHLKNVRAQRFI